MAKVLKHISSWASLGTPRRRDRHYRNAKVKVNAKERENWVRVWRDDVFARSYHSQEDQIALTGPSYLYYEPACYSPAEEYFSIPPLALASHEKIPMSPFLHIRPATFQGQTRLATGSRLPLELWIDILGHIDDRRDLVHVALLCRALYVLAQDALAYHTVRLESSDSIFAFSDTIAGTLGICTLVHNLSISSRAAAYPYRDWWDHLIATHLTQTLAALQNVHTLSVFFESDDSPSPAALARLLSAPLPRLRTFVTTLPCTLELLEFLQTHGTIEEMCLMDDFSSDEHDAVPATPPSSPSTHWDWVVGGDGALIVPGIGFNTNARTGRGMESNVERTISALNPPKLLPFPSLRTLTCALPFLRCFAPRSTRTLTHLHVAVHAPGTLETVAALLGAQLVSLRLGLPSWIPDVVPGTRVWTPEDVLARFVSLRYLQVHMLEADFVFHPIDWFYPMPRSPSPSFLDRDCEPGLTVAWILDPPDPDPDPEPRTPPPSAAVPARSLALARGRSKLGSRVRRRHWQAQVQPQPQLYGKDDSYSYSYLGQTRAKALEAERERERAEERKRARDELDDMALVVLRGWGPHVTRVMYGVGVGGDMNGNGDSSGPDTEVWLSADRTRLVRGDRRAFGERFWTEVV